MDANLAILRGNGNRYLTVWGVYRDKSPGVHHTGILLKFSDGTCYKVDFKGDVKNDGYIRCGIRSCSGIVRLTVTNGRRMRKYTYYGDVQRFGQNDVELTWEICRAILEPPAAQYSMFSKQGGKNCRDHVRGVLHRVCAMAPDHCNDGVRNSTLNKLQKQEREDYSRVGLGIIGFAGIVILAWWVTKK